MGPLFSADDLLVRMFLSPAYWWQSVRQVVQGLRQLGAACNAASEGTRVRR